MRRILKTAAIQVQAQQSSAETVKKAVELIELSVKEGGQHIRRQIGRTQIYPGVFVHLAPKKTATKSIPYDYYSTIP